MWRLAMIFVPVTLIFFAAQVAVFVGTRLAYPGEYPDPFAPYEALMPGRLAAPGDYPCAPRPTYPDIQNVLCEIHPDSSHFVSVSSDIFNRRFVRTSFRGHDLYIGDVVRRWGRPDVIASDGQYFYVRWNNRRLIGMIDPVGSFGRFHYMLPVERFVIGLQQFPNTIP